MDTSETNEKKSASLQVRADVAEALAQSGQQIRTLVISDLTQTEIAKRKVAVLKVLSKVDEAYKELRKQESQGERKFDLAGTPIGEPSFTKAQLGEIKKVKEEVAKLQAALEKAFSDNDFQKVLELGS